MALTEALFFERLIKSVCEVSGPDELRKLHQTYADRYPFLLQSTAIGGELGRFDILFLDVGDELALRSDGTLSGASRSGEINFLDALDDLWLSERIDPIDTHLPFTGGWFIYLAYELAGQVEARLKLQPDTVLPVAFAVRCRAAIIYDHERSECTFVSENKSDVQIAMLRDDIANLTDSDNKTTAIEMSIREDSPQQFTDAVRHAKQHIEAGDVYQANLSRQWNVQLTADVSAADIYASLCDANPAPFAGIVNWRDATIISSSPERLLQVRDGIISTRPIAGTRPRSDDPGSDEDLSSELFAHPKERAEHVMLIDLERNDLGRVSEPGSVEVDEMMVLESYAHVHHIVSNVRGTLRPDVTPGQSIAAVFPGGTITGCPKVRCMEIISDLEVSARGAYTGSFGYLNRDGSMDLNILIRTMVKQGNELTFRAGAGIVADSIPAAELDETRAKAKGLLKALKNA